MKLRNLLTLQLLVAVAAVFAGMTSPAAQAANINFIATDCQVLQFAPQPEPPPVIKTNGGVSNPGDFPYYAVACNVPRSPLAVGATFGGFYVDGDNHTADVSTTCSISSYNYTGTYLGSSSFTASGASYPVYDMYLSLPVAQLPTWAYTVLNCSLPTNGRGTLRGVTSIS